MTHTTTWETSQTPYIQQPAREERDNHVFNAIDRLIRARATGDDDILLVCEYEDANGIAFTAAELDEIWYAVYTRECI